MISIRGNKMTRTFIKFNDYLVDRLKYPIEAKAHLELAIGEYEKNGNTEAFMLMLRESVRFFV